MEFWTNCSSSVMRNERTESSVSLPSTGRNADTCAKRSSLSPRQTSAADCVGSVLQVLASMTQQKPDSAA